MAFDVVVRHGRVLDGTGMPWTVADLGIRKGRIAKMGRIGRAAAGLVIAMILTSRARATRSIVSRSP